MLKVFISKNSKNGISTSSTFMFGVFTYYYNEAIILLPSVLSSFPSSKKSLKLTKSSLYSSLNFRTSILYSILDSLLRLTKTFKVTNNSSAYILSNEITLIVEPSADKNYLIDKFWEPNM
jgi:hypothetical protein